MNRKYIDLLKINKWVKYENDKLVAYLPYFYSLNTYFNAIIKEKLSKYSYQEINLIDNLTLEEDCAYYYFVISKNDGNIPYLDSDNIPFIKTIYRNENVELCKHHTLDLLSLYERVMEEYASIPFISGKIISNDEENSFGIFVKNQDSYICLMKVTYHNNTVNSIIYPYFIYILLIKNIKEDRFIIPPRLSPLKLCFMMENNPFAKDIKLVTTWIYELEKVNLKSSIDTSSLSMKEKIDKHLKQGIPLLIEVYHKNIEKNKFTLIINYNLEKRKISFDDFKLLPILLEEIQRDIYKDSLKKYLQDKQINIPCCMKSECLNKFIDDDYYIISSFMQTQTNENCVCCNEKMKKNLIKIKKF